jgi:hypothetical protein
MNPRARIWNHQVDGGQMEEHLHLLIVGWIEARGHPREASYSVIAGVAENGWMRRAKPICDIVYIEDTSNQQVDNTARQIFLRAAVPSENPIWVRSFSEQISDTPPTKMVFFRVCSADISGHERLKAIRMFEDAENWFDFAGQGESS